MTEPIRIIERNAGDVTILELQGRLVLDEGDVPFRKYVNRLVQDGRIKIIVDMRKVTRIDSVGIGILVAKYVTTYLRGGRLKLLNLTARGETLMDITRLYTVFEIFESEDEAIRSFEHDRASAVMPPIKEGPPKQ